MSDLDDLPDVANVADVAIVGAGPAGAVAAKLCGVHGLTAVAFDREPDVYELPRAVGMWDDVQRILDNAGVLETALPSMCEHVGAEFVDADGTRINGIELPPGFVTASGYPFIRGFHQPDLERAVRLRLANHAGIELHVSHEVLEIVQTHDHVSLVVRNLARGDTRTVRARWLLGCDGAASLVRKSCGVSWDSLGYDHEWLVVDVAITGDVELPPLMTQVCDPARPTTVIPLPLGMHRWEFQLRDGETREEMEDRERVWSLLAPWMSRTNGEILRAVVYRFHATIADTFRRGRIFLAGDAAHQTPPFMGQGLCSGMRDVDNLIWKLAHVTHGLAGDALLDTYTEERRPMAIAMVEHSVKTGMLIDAYAQMAVGGPEPPADLQAYAYGGSAQLPHLSTGLLAQQESEWIGRPIPQCAAATDDRRGSFDDIVGPRWAVVSKLDPRQRLSEQSRRYWEDLGAAFVWVPEPEGAILGVLLQHEMVVVRPDRIVYAIGDEHPDLQASTSDEAANSTSRA